MNNTMVKKFTAKVGEKKALLNATIDIELMNMLKEIKEIFKVNLSNATNDVLQYFKDEAWDKGAIELPEDHKKEEEKGK